MIIDCSDCRVRDIACADCVVTVLLGAPGWPGQAFGGVGAQASKVDFDQAELGAMGVLADVGLVPRLRLVVDEQNPSTGQSLSARDNGGDRRVV